MGRPSAPRDVMTVTPVAKCPMAFRNSAPVTSGPGALPGLRRALSGSSGAGSILVWGPDPRPWADPRAGRALPFGGCGTQAPQDGGGGTRAPCGEGGRLGVVAHKPRKTGAVAHVPHAVRADDWGLWHTSPARGATPTLPGALPSKPRLICELCCQ